MSGGGRAPASWKIHVSCAPDCMAYTDFWRIYSVNTHTRASNTRTITIKLANSLVTCVVVAMRLAGCGKSSMIFDGFVMEI